MPLRACLVCGQPSKTTRCPLHTRPDPRDTYAYRQARAQVKREENVCWICGEGARADDPWTADHLHPVVHGGASTRDNLRLAHRSCNSRRGSPIGPPGVVEAIEVSKSTAPPSGERVC